MATVTARAPQPGNEKGRPGTGRPLTNFVNHDNAKDSPEHLRIQFLFSHLGMNGSRAALMSSLIWGVAA